MSKLLTVLFLFASNLVWSAVSIQGKAESHAGKKVVAYLVQDHLSDKLLPLKVENINNKGEFKFDLDINDTRQIVLAIPPYQGVLYVEPGNTYRIVFPTAMSGQVKRFDKTDVILDLQQLPENDLNLLIRQFNADYFDFLNQHFYDFAVGEYRGSDVVKSNLAKKNDGVDLYKRNAADSSDKRVVSNFGNVVTEFFNTTQLKYGGHYKNLFFSNYVKYSLAEIELVAGKNKKLFYKEYFMSQQPLIHNPAYAKTFKLFYSNFFNTRSKPIEESIKRSINVGRSSEQMLTALKSDSLVLSSDLRFLVAVMGLKESYFDKSYARDHIEYMLGEMASAKVATNLREAAGGTLYNIQRGKQGWQLEEFQLADESNETWKLSEYQGSYTYFLFFATWNAASLKEMLLLEKLHQNYGDFVQIVAINMDDDVEVLKRYIKEHKTQKFKFLFGTGDVLLRDKFVLYSLPHATMIDPDGRVMFNFTRKPSEGIQEEFEKIKRTGVGVKQGPKTWKDK